MYQLAFRREIHSLRPYEKQNREDALSSSFKEKSIHSLSLSLPPLAQLVKRSPYVLVLLCAAGFGFLCVSISQQFQIWSTSKESLMRTSLESVLMDSA